MKFITRLKGLIGRPTAAPEDGNKNIIFTTKSIKMGLVPNYDPVDKLLIASIASEFDNPDMQDRIANLEKWVKRS